MTNIPEEKIQTFAKVLLEEDIGIVTLESARNNAGWRINEAVKLIEALGGKISWDLTEKLK